jgi:hypothetical protein
MTTRDQFTKAGWTPEQADELVAAMVSFEMLGMAPTSKAILKYGLEGPLHDRYINETDEPWLLHSVRAHLASTRARGTEK